MVCDTGKNVGKPGLRIDMVHFCCDNQTVHGGGPLTTAVGTGKQPSPPLFAGSDKGGERAAAILSLIETAKLNGLDPEAYRRDDLARIPDHPINRIDDLLPWSMRHQDQ